MSHESMSLIASWGVLLALILLFLGSMINWKSTGNMLLLFTCLGFALAVIGNLYRSYIAYYPGALSAAPQTIEGFFNYANQQAAYGSLVSGLGLTVAGVSYLIFVLKREKI